jgi:heme/copper-type cytochrome/quinol oxidase subunit 3
MPSLLWSSLVAGVAIASEFPNAWIKRRARQHELRATQTGLSLITGIGVALLLLRTLELASLDVRWDDNAQGSIIWSLLVLHTAYMAAAVIGWGLMTAQSFRAEMTGRRFSAIASSVLQWHFIVWSSVALYVVIDWSPRML